MAIAYGSSFSSTVPSWTRAKQIHGFLKAFATGIVDHDGQGRNQQNANLKEAQQAEIWNGLTKQGPTKKIPLLTNAIDWTMPPEYTGLFVICDSIAAVFALQCLDQCLAGVDLTDGLAVRDAMPHGWEAFRKRKQAANKIQEGFDCDKSAGWMTLRDIDDLNDRTLLRKIQSIADLAGKMFDSLAPTKIRTPSNDPHSVKGATLGGDIERLLPSEQAKLATEATADMTAMKVVKKGAQQFKLQGTRTTSRGPMVLVIDSSGSMHDEPGARGRNTWAKASGIALARIAWQENRAVKVVHFGSSTVVAELPKNDQKALFEFARTFLSGGTDIACAMDRAREQVGDLEKSGHKGADVVLVTDGCDHDQAAHNAELDRFDALGIRLYSVGIGMDFQKSHPLRTRAEQYVYAHDGGLAHDGDSIGLLAPLVGAALDNSGNEDLN